jgi:hypothetical protein
MRSQSCIVRHNGKELLLVDLAILVEVKLINHSLSVHMARQ